MKIRDIVKFQIKIKIMITRTINDEMKDKVIHIYWNESAKLRRENKPPISIYPINELFSINTTNEEIQNYHRLATLELRKQKINKIWEKIQA